MGENFERLKGDVLETGDLLVVQKQSGDNKGHKVKVSWEQIEAAIGGGGGGLRLTNADLPNIRTLYYDRSGSYNNTWDGVYTNNTPSGVAEAYGGRTSVTRLFDPETDTITEVFGRYLTGAEAGLDIAPNDLITVLNEVSLFMPMGWINWTAFNPVNGEITAPAHGRSNFGSTRVGGEIHTVIVIDPATGLQVVGSEYRYTIKDEDTFQPESGFGPYPELEGYLAAGHRLYVRRGWNRGDHPIFVDPTGLDLRVGFRFLPVGNGAWYGMT